MQTFSFLKSSSFSEQQGLKREQEGANSRRKRRYIYGEEEIFLPIIMLASKAEGAILILDDPPELRYRNMYHRIFPSSHEMGWMAEWSKALVLGTSLWAWVRIPLQSHTFVSR